MLPEVLAVCELASSMPVNGAFYWWSGALAPPEWSHCISFVSGWLNIFSMFTATASFAYAVASSLTYAITIILPTMQWTDSQIMAISMGVVIIWAALMSFKLESIITVYICLGSSCEMIIISENTSNKRQLHWSYYRHSSLYSHYQLLTPCKSCLLLLARLCLPR